MTEVERTLVVTVGGSDAPIVRAIADHRPQRTVFVCSEDDAASERKGSYTQVEGGQAESIPQQAKLAPESWSVVRVPADDLNRIFNVVLETLIAEKRAAREVIVDYTGGTKSMSAAAVLAATHAEGVALSLVMGLRTDLKKVVDGTEFSASINIDTAESRLGLRLAASAWRRYAYDEAVTSLREVSNNARRDPAVQRVLMLSQGYAAWDSMAYDTAIARLEQFARFVNPAHLSAARELARPDATERSEALRIVDLLYMAERRKGSGLFDIAVLLYYRIVEAVAQWSLRWHHQIDASNVGEELAAGTLRDVATRAHNGNFVLGLDSAWRALALLDGPLAPCARAIGDEERRGFSSCRNRSVLAHGDTPIDAATLAHAESFVRDKVMPSFVKAAFGKKGVPYGQLPSHWEQEKR